MYFLIKIFCLRKSKQVQKRTQLWIGKLILSIEEKLFSDYFSKVIGIKQKAFIDFLGGVENIESQKLVAKRRTFRCLHCKMPVNRLSVELFR